MLVYLDNSATTRAYDEVIEEMVKVMKENYGNPSSLHTLGFEAEKKIKTARRSFAKSIGAKEEEVYFNSGGTEGDNSVILGAARARKRQGNKVITTAVEHPAVLESFKRLEEEGFDVRYIGVDRHCNLDMEQLKEEITDDTILISVMAVNNEIGTIMPIREIAKLKKNALFHTDAVQGYGKVNLAGVGADFVTVSGHKIHGPKGVGAMMVSRGINLPPYLIGGGQENKQRSGTENVPAISGFGLACDMAMKNFDENVKAMKRVRDYLAKGLTETLDNIIINSPEDGAASVLNVTFLGTRGEVLLHTLEQDQIYVSTGSACSSNKKGGSHVLKAMGLSDKEIEGTIRFSFSHFNTMEEMDFVLEKTKAAVERFRKLGAFR